MKRLLLVLAVQVIAFWDVWRWYVSRAVYSWDQPWGVLALIAAVVFLVASRKPWPKTERSLLLPTLLVIFYAATFFPFAPLARATVAFTALAVTISSLRFGKSFHPGLFGLFYLSLPTLPTLQFFGGYPLRVVVAELTAPILRIKWLCSHTRRNMPELGREDDLDRRTVQRHQNAVGRAVLDVRCFVSL